MRQTPIFRHKQFSFLYLAIIAALPYPAPADPVTYQQNADGQPYSYTFPNPPPNPTGATHTDSGSFPINNNWSQSYTTATDGDGDVYEIAPSNWSTLNPPNSPTTDVLIPGFTVTLNIPVSVANLTLTSSSILDMLYGDNLSVYGTTLSNDGNILINSNTGAVSTSLTFNANTLLTGSGAVTLNYPNANAQINTGSSDTLTQDTHHTIQGYGQVNASLINNGTVSANVSAQILTLQTNSMTNNSLFQAINGGNLTINGITVTQNSPGQISAANGSAVFLTNATVSASALNSAGNGYFQINGTSTLDSLTNNAPINIPYNNTLDITGNLVNNNTITVDSNTGAFATILSFNGGTLSGTGSILLNYPGANSQLNGSLTQSSSHTIQGYGQINASLTNNGTVSANVNGQVLTLQTNPMTNNSLFQATNGGTLTLNGITVTQGSSGQLLAADTSAVNLTNATISSGTLNSSGTGFFQISGTSTLNTLTNNAKINVPYNNTLDITGNLTNNGTITVNSNTGNATAILSFNGGTLSGTGSILLNHPGTNAQLNGSLTQSFLHIIKGYGQINATLTNQGIVDANSGSNTLYVLSPGGVTNTNLLEATSGGILQFDSAVPVNNTSGQITANGGTVNFENGASLTAGSLTSISPSVINVISYNSTLGYTANFNSLTLTTGSQLNIVAGNILSITGASFTNNGNITVNSNTSGAAASLTFNANTLLTGTGAVTLNYPNTNAQINTGTSDTLTQDTHHTIQGYGQINASLINNGTVSANINGQALTLQTNAMTNNNLFQSINGGTLTLNGITVTQGLSGQISAATASTVNLTNATVSSGALNSTGTGLFQINGTSTLNSLTNNAAINVPYNNTLDITGNLTNNGTITVNSNTGNATAILSFNGGTLSGTGSILLNHPGTNAQLNGSLTQSSPHTIQGYGQIDAVFTNNSTISANVSGQTLNLLTNPETNNSLIQATGGGTLTVNSITLTQGASGQLLAADTSAVNLTNATISAGTLNSAGTGFFQINGTSTLDTLTNNAKINVPYNNTLDITGNLADNGLITVNSNTGNATAILSFNGGTLSGTGSILLNHPGTNAQLNGSLTQSSPHTIQGYGQINATLTNNGSVIANVSGQTLSVNSATTNNGSVQATNGGTLSFATGVLTNLSGTTLTGGSYEVDTNSTITLPGSITTNSATITLNGAGTTFNALSTLNTNNTSFTIKNGANFTRTGSFTNAGLLAAGPSSTLRITGPLTNASVVDVAGGTVKLDQGLATGTVLSQLHSAYDNGAWDGLGISSSLAANDTSHLTGVGYLVSGTSYTLKRTYYGDANLDGSITADDYALIDRGFDKHLPVNTATWQQGDFNYDGSVTSADYLLIDKSYALQTGSLSPDLLAQRESEFGPAYVQSLIASVPEPALACLLALPFFGRRRKSSAR